MPDSRDSFFEGYVASQRIDHTSSPSYKGILGMTTGEAVAQAMATFGGLRENQAKWQAFLNRNNKSKIHRRKLIVLCCIERSQTL